MTSPASPVPSGGRPDERGPVAVHEVLRTVAVDVGHVEAEDRGAGVAEPGRRSERAAEVRQDVDGVAGGREHEVHVAVGVEIAGPLTAALERINSPTSTGNIDRKGLRALREEVESARRVGMIGQQLTRFASGRIRQSHERLQLAGVPI